jgi:hypothetical protein
LNSKPSQSDQDWRKLEESSIMMNIVATRGGVKLSACSDPAIAEHADETSIAVFESLDPELTARREQQILKYIKARGGATCWEIENALGLLHQSASSTITRLRKGGHLVDTGERRPTNTGRMATVWGAAY